LENKYSKVTIVMRLDIVVLMVMVVLAMSILGIATHDAAK